MTTKWQVQPSLIFDTLCLLNSLIGDPFYLTYYQQEYDALAAKMTPEVRQALARLKRLKDDRKTLIGPFLCWLFSAGSDQTLADLIKTVEDSEPLRDAVKRLHLYDEDDWIFYEAARPDLRTAFLFLQVVRFDAHWRRTILPIIQKKKAALQKELRAYNVIAEDERVLGYALPSDTITVHLLYFNQPHGLKVTGQRFCTGVVYPPEVVVRNAVHELMHPPFGPPLKPLDAMWKVVDQLQTDAFLMDKVLHHNPSFGYNTFRGYIEEDCVQALEQTASERLQIAREAHQRWKLSDDGMHVFAVALYAVMKEEDYNARNEEFSEFLVRMIQSGKLAPGRIRPLYERFYAAPVNK